MMNGSGDIAIAFTTANRIPHSLEPGVLSMQMLHDDKMDIVFRAAVEVIEESVISSLLHAKGTYSRNGKYIPSLGDIWKNIADEISR